MSQASQKHPGSFRDPAGFIFQKNGILYRQVNKSFEASFDAFEKSGACQKFIDKNWLIPHQRIAENLTGDSEAALFLQPERLPFISYPYEWSFDMLRDAALLTIQLAENCLEYNLQLKDATPYNIQWKNGKPLFIDSLSFEPLRPGPWIAYRQFCESFLAPLLLMHNNKQHLPELLKAWPDGMPLATVASMLPWRSRFSIHTYLHIHMQAKMSKKTTGKNPSTEGFGKDKLKRIFLSLKTLVQSLKTPDSKTEWADYYEEAGQRGEYLLAKQALVKQWIREMSEIKQVLDLGANEGAFTEIAVANNLDVIAADIDPECINRLYLQGKKQQHPQVTPLVQDLSWPSPGMGVNNQERSSFLSRARGDLAMALALIHHLAIHKKMPFDSIRDMFLPMAPQLIIEFVPAEDEKAALLLNRLEGLKPAYTQERFEHSFLQSYEIHKKANIAGSSRILYWLSRK
ncbi:MAG: class I SAM-dependent methyltransferase [Chitinophagaceae bacterium]|nr:class I SAM-dependent methyltransferase [Chitinophagaceae bacterium]